MATTVEAAAESFVGTWGELWINGRKWAEVTAFQAKVSKTKKNIDLCGTMFEHSVVTAVKGTGSATLNHVDSEVVVEESAVLNGVDPHHTLIGKIRHPGTGKTIRTAFGGVSFDDITLMDWKAAEAGKVTKPFTFTDYKFLDTVDPE